VIRMAIGDRDLLLTVDTGFNGDMLLAASAAASVGLTTDAAFTNIELGDGTTATLAETEYDMSWLDRRRLIRVRISSDWAPRGDDPVGLVGTKLISPHLLLIDFEARSVEIEAQ
jgi:predicted aspartyl protease